MPELHTVAIIHGFQHRRDGVGGAGGGGDDVVVGGQLLVVDVEDDRREIVARRSGDNDLLCAGLDMCLSQWI